MSLDQACLIVFVCFSTQCLLSEEVVGACVAFAGTSWDVASAPACWESSDLQGACASAGTSWGVHAVPLE